MSTFTQPDSVGVNDLPLTNQITEEIAPGFILNDVDRQIVKIRPMATPLDQISRSGRARSTRTIEVKYYAVDLKDAATQTAAAIAANSMDVVDGQVSCSIAMKNARIFSQTDTFMIADTSSAPGGENMLFYVTEVSGDKVSAILINARVSDEGTFQHAAIPAEAKVVRMARAASELDVQSPQYQALPRSKSNNCQIFKIQVEESTLQRLAPNQAGWTFSDQEEIAVSDMRMGMERSFLFGSRAKIHDLEKDQDIYFTGGIWNQTDKTFNYEKGQLTANSLVQLCSRVFTGQNGSPVKVLFAGSGLVDALSSLDYTKTISAERTVAKWGLELREIRSTYGAIYLVHSEVFDQCGRANDGMVVDPNYITKYVHTPFTVEKLDLRQSGQRNTDAVVLTEISCLVLRYPNAHCRIICDE